MKPVENPTRQPEVEEVESDGSYYCKFCGTVNSGVAFYSESVYGTARLVFLDGELDDYETTDSDGFEVSTYTCGNCGGEGINPSDLFSYEPPLEEEER